MKTQKTIQIRVRKPTEVQFGDFTITDVDFSDNHALADFGDGTKTRIDVSRCVNDIKKYTRAKRFYARLV